MDRFTAEVIRAYSDKPIELQVPEMSKESGYQEEDEDEFISRSQLKRDMHALQQLGERLIKLKPSQWEQFEFSAAMMDALDESRRIKSHNAMRRHTRRLGKLLKSENSAQIETLFQRMDNEHLQDTKRFHRLERWRDRLLEEGDQVINELLTLCPEADRQHLRQLVRSGKKERLEQKPPAIQRKLFRYLKELDFD